MSTIKRVSISKALEAYLLHILEMIDGNQMKQHGLN